MRCGWLLAAALVGCGAAEGSRGAPPVCPSPAATATAAEKAPGEDALEESVATPALTFVFRASLLGNLSYELDCLSNVVPCSGPAYRELWKGTLGEDQGDVAALEEWARIRKRYEVSAESDANAPPAGEAPLPHLSVPPPDTSFDLGQHVRVAALVARGPEDYARLDGLFLGPADAARTAALYARFLPRFAAYWKSTGRAAAEELHAGLVKLFREGALAKTLSDVARFYAPELPPGTRIEFDLVLRPKSSHPTTRAEQIGSHAVVELVPGEAPADRVDVVSHELFHFFYNSRTRAAQRALVGRTAGADDALAAVAYELLDESVATALGNGLVASVVAPDRYQKRLAKDLGFYNDRAIDRVSKALLPRLRDLLAAGATIDSPDFAAALLSATHAALDKDLRPSDYLHSLVVAASPGYEEALSAFQSAASVNNAYVYSPLASARAHEELDEYADLGAVFLVAAPDAGELATWNDALPALAAAKIAALAKTDAPFVYTVPRGKKAYLFVLVAKDVVGMATLAEWLAHAPTITLGESRPPK